MIIYLFSLPIWNAVLPAYAFWHFDDFSWGATRQIEGEGAGESHGDKEGEFDPSHIVMKRWAEFERDRRYRTGTNSRDSTDDLTRSPRRNDNRKSVNSNFDGGSGSTLDILRIPPSSASRGSLSGPPLIELPQPLSSHSNVPSGFTPPPVPKIPTNLVSYGDSNRAIDTEQPLIYSSPDNSPERDQGSNQRLSSMPHDSYHPQPKSIQKQSFIEEDDNYFNKPLLGINLMDQGPIGESPRRVAKPAYKRRMSPSSSLALEQLNQYSQQRRDERVDSSEDNDLDLPPSASHS